MKTATPAIVGAIDFPFSGSTVGTKIGETVGLRVGRYVGSDVVGELDGLAEGEEVGSGGAIQPPNSFAILQCLNQRKCK